MRLSRYLPHYYLFLLPLSNCTCWNNLWPVYSRSCCISVAKCCFYIDQQLQSSALITFRPCLWRCDTKFLLIFCFSTFTSAFTFILESLLSPSNLQSTWLRGKFSLFSSPAHVKSPPSSSLSLCSFVPKTPCSTAASSASYALKKQSNIIYNNIHIIQYSLRRSLPSDLIIPEYVSKGAVLVLCPAMRGWAMLSSAWPCVSAQGVMPSTAIPEPSLNQTFNPCGSLTCWGTQKPPEAFCPQ